MSLNRLSTDLPRRAKGKLQTSRLPQDAGKGVAAIEEDGATKALDALTKFIPTEILAPYVAALSLASTQNWNSQTIYWSFVIVTPLMFLLFEFAKDAIEKKPWPAISPLVWRALAATIAFAAWGLSVPTNPLQVVIGGAAVAGFIALVVSPILTAFDAIILRTLGTTSD